MSLDGVVSDNERWMLPISDEILKESLEYYETLDAIIIGSNFYPHLAEYWQNAEKSSKSRAERIFAKKINGIKKFVISRSPVNIVWNNSEWITIEDNFTDEIYRLKKTMVISVESGIGTWQLFIRNLVFDELKVNIHPVVAGTGKKLFVDENLIRMHLKGSKVFQNGVVMCLYERL